MRLLIAEDDADIAKALTALFEHNNYIVDTVADGIAAYDYASMGSYDGMVLDIMMPGMDGLELLRRLRAAGISTPVLLLTARSEVEDRVQGLDAGADDYLSKPFAASELLARVRAMLRRKDHYQGDVLEFRGMRLNLATFELSCGQANIQLAGREFQMMQLLMQSPGVIISTDHFMDQIWGWDSEVDVSVVWVYISNLRKKIEKINAPVVIRAIRGVGYCLSSPEHDTARLEKG